MVMGYLGYDGKNQNFTRISNTTSIVNKKNLQLENNIYIGHYNFIEASNNITIASDGFTLGAVTGTVIYIAIKAS